MTLAEINAARLVRCALDLVHLAADDLDVSDAMFDVAIATIQQFVDHQVTEAETASLQRIVEELRRLRKETR